MIEIKDNTFHLSTDNTSYIFSVSLLGLPEQIYYGKKLKKAFFSLDAIKEKHINSPSFSLEADSRMRDLALNDTKLEFSTEGFGDFKNPALAISRGQDGKSSLDLRYSGYDTHPGILKIRDSLLPQALSKEKDADTLEVFFTDKDAKIKLTVVYTIFKKADTITRRFVIENKGKDLVKIRKIASSQFDIREKDGEIISLQGAWGRERNITKTKLTQGTFSLSSPSIFSSSEVNPAFIYSSSSGAYLFNLVYSGSFKAAISVTEFNLTHIVWGINEDLFSWSLLKNDYFETPEAILIYSPHGIEGVSKLSHYFIENHIKRGEWKDRLRPLMFNTRDAYGFALSEKKIDDAIKFSKDVGLEGILIGDGWFGTRNNEKTSLGDWWANAQKFPSGLQLVSSEIHRSGLMVGLWVEMEAVSEKSDLIKRHPEWILGGQNQAKTKNEYLLDLSRREVQEYIIETVSSLIEIDKIDFIHWTVNRYASNIITEKEINDYSEYAHRYIIGLYKVLRTIKERYPNLYLETSALGSSRFDLGMLCFSDTILSSDNTDPISRLNTLLGTALVYPLSVIKNTISPSPFLFRRRVSRATLFNAAVFGTLEYSVNPEECDKEFKKACKKQIEFYLTHRTLFQYGLFTSLEDRNRVLISINNQDSSFIALLYLQKLMEVNTTSETLKVRVANENYDYLFYARPHYLTENEEVNTPQEGESYKISGDALKWAGIKLVENTSGTGYKFGMRNLSDFSSRLYLFRKVDK